MSTETSPIENTLNEALASVIESAAQAKDFILAELPDVITQLLWWHGVKSFLMFAFWIGLVAVAGIVLHRMFKPGPLPENLDEYTKVRIQQLLDKSYYRRSYSEDRELQRLQNDSGIERDPESYYGVMLPYAGIGSGIVGLTLYTQTDWLQILIAPKVYLIEYAAKLL